MVNFNLPHALNTSKHSWHSEEREGLETTGHLRTGKELLLAVVFPLQVQKSISPPNPRSSAAEGHPQP